MNLPFPSILLPAVAEYASGSGGRQPSQLYGWALTGINVGLCHLSGHMIGRDEVQASRINQSATAILIAPMIGSGSYKQR